MKNAEANLPTQQFPQPPGIVSVKIHQSGRRAGPCDLQEEIREEHYKTGTEPQLDVMLNQNCPDQIMESDVTQDKEPEL
jgi:membrane carboxypeptidase/penicillin-binding protein